MSLAEPHIFASRAADPRSRPDVSEPPPSKRLLQALAALDAGGVPYCYWKQSSKLDRVLCGQSDLDLLVARRAREPFSAVMQGQGFKAWPDAGALHQAAFVSFLGYDEETGRILHVHAHFRLVLGDALLKTIHIPIEEELIARSLIHPRYPIPILDPLDETLLLRLRAALEGGWLDLVAWRRRLRRSFGAGQDDTLGDFAEGAAIQARAETFLSQRCARLLAESDAANAGRRRTLRRALRRELKPWRHYGLAQSTFRTLWRSVFLILARVNRRFLEIPMFARRPAPGGGVLIAFVGVDGSGKSTQVRQASQWLGSELDVMTRYFGSGDGKASLLFRPLKVVAEAIGSRLREKPKGASHGNVSDRHAGPLYSVLFAVWALAVAWDKRVKLISAQRAVSRGFVVVTDRYPQNEIPGYNDGPLLHRLASAPRWLINLERSVYELAERMPPDLVLKLHVGPATVAKREPDMRPDLILQRIEWLKKLSCGGATCVSIDASAPLADVTRTVRRAIWDIL